MAKKYIGETALRQLWSNIENKIESEVANIDVSSSESLNIPTCDTHYYSSSEGNYERINHYIDWNDAYQAITINQTSDIENSWLSNYSNDNEISNAGFVNLSVLNSGGEDYEIDLPDISYVQYMINNNIENSLSNYISQSDFIGEDTYSHIAFMSTGATLPSGVSNPTRLGILMANLSDYSPDVWRRVLTTEDLSEIYASIDSCMQDSEGTYEGILNGIKFGDSTVWMANPSNDNTYELLTSDALSITDEDAKAYISYNGYSFPDISYVDYQIDSYLNQYSYISEGSSTWEELTSTVTNISWNLSHYCSAYDIETNLSSALDPESSLYHDGFNAQINNKITNYLNPVDPIEYSSFYEANGSFMAALTNYLLENSEFTASLTSIINQA